MTSAFLGIANSALTRCVEKLLTSIDDRNERGERIRRLLPDICREVLETHNWDTATKRVIRVQDAGGPHGAFAMSFSLPQDWVRTTLVLPTAEPATGERQYGRPLSQWQVQGRKLMVGLTPAGTTAQLGLCYVAYDEEMAGQWSASLRNCIATLLAARIAPGTSGGYKLADSLEVSYQRYLIQAQRLDTSMEGSFLDRYDPSDEGQTFQNYSQLSGGFIGGSYAGVGYCQVS